MKKFLIALATVTAIGVMATAVYVGKPEKLNVNDERFVEKLAEAIYDERHKTDPTKYHWATWEDFLASEEGSARAQVWRDDVRLGVRVLVPLIQEELTK